MIDIQELKRQKAALVTQMRDMVAAVESRDDKTQTDEERSTLTSLQDQAEKLEADIRSAEFLNAQEEVVPPLDGENREAFQDFGEFIVAVRNGDNSRLETREMTMGDGEQAGFLVPEQFDTEIRALMPEAGIVRPNATVIPAGSTPDAAINLTALDQTGDKGVYGGLQTAWTGETSLVASAGDATLKQIKLEPNNISGYVDVSNKLLNNTTAFAAYLQQLLAGTIMGAEEDAFYNGDGVSKPLGILKSAAAVKVARKAVDVISYDDIVKMNTLIKGTNLKWVINRVALQSLQTMVAPNTNNLVWQPGAIPGAPSTLFGIPVEYNPYAPVLGEFGDIALLDMKNYVIKDGSGLSIFIDPYTQMGNQKTRMYISWNVDGQSLLTGPMLAQDKKTKVSPFVVLD